MYYNAPKMSHKFKKTSKVVVSGEIKQSHHLPSLKKNKKSWLIIGLVTGLVVLASATGYFLYKQKVADNAVSTACTDKSANGILDKAAKVIAPSQVAELQPIVKQIETLKNYDQDPNCLGVITTYYINISDSQNAQVTYAKLDKFYKPSTGYNSAINGKVLSPAGMKPTINLLKARAQRIKDNAASMGASNAN